MEQGPRFPGMRPWRRTLARGPFPALHPAPGSHPSTIRLEPAPPGAGAGWGWNMRCKYRALSPPSQCPLAAFAALPLVKGEGVAVTHQKHRQGCSWRPCPLRQSQIFGTPSAQGRLCSTRRQVGAGSRSGTCQRARDRRLERGRTVRVRQRRRGHQASARRPASREGLQAALLAEQGVEGPPDVIEARDGFMQAFAFCRPDKARSSYSRPPYRSASPTATSSPIRAAGTSSPRSRR